MLQQALNVRRRARRRRVVGSLAALGAAPVALALLLGSCFAGPHYTGPASDHFDGERFRNDPPESMPGVFSMAGWFVSREPGPWTDHWNEPPGPPPAERVDGGRLVVTAVGHATLLIQVDGLNILTDPIWSDRCSPVPFAGPRRVRPPAIRFEDLPPIDVVLVSHNHYDHMDLETLRRLRVMHHPRIFVGLGNGPLLRGARPGEVTEVDWWQEFPVGRGVVVASVPVNHFSARGLGDRDATLWTGYVLKTSRGNVYFAGDTGYGHHFADVGRRYSPIRLALLPIGAYDPEWIMHVVHVTPDEALRARDDLHAQTSVAMHFGTFPMADDGETAPVDRLRAALAAHPGPADFRVPEFGRAIDVP